MFLGKIVMKKTLLVMLLCGFVLNNGYCFDGRRKINGSYLDGLFSNLVELQQKTISRYNSMSKNAMNLSTTRYLYYFTDGVVHDIDEIIQNNLNRFVQDFLTSVIPGGKNRGRMVSDLLREQKLDEETLKTICRTSSMFEIKRGVFSNTIVFRSDKLMIEVYATCGGMFSARLCC